METGEPARDASAAFEDDRKQLLEQISAFGFAEHSEELTRIARPAALLRYTRAIDAPVRVGASKIGGEPDLPEDVAWPAKLGTSMAFVAQIELRELARATRIDDFGREGWLSFFYDTERQAWGFRSSDRGSWKVLFTPAERALARRSFPSDLVAYARFKSRAVEFVRFLSIPDFGRVDDSRPRGWSLDDFGRYDDLRRAPFTRFALYPPLHQCGGYPHPIQADEMELECQLVSNGIELGSGRPTNDPRVELLRRDAAQWKLLLQVDCDDSLGMDWGLGGTTYFWIRDDDLRRGDFDHVWLVFQTT
jgi:uncharacterized protein YwqG